MAELIHDKDPAQQELFMNIFVQMNPRYQQLLICQFDNKTPNEIGAILPISRKMLKDRFYDMRQRFANLAGGNKGDALALFPPLSRSSWSPSSVVKGIDTHLPLIDRECRYLSARLTRPDFDMIACSLFELSVDANKAGVILEYLNTPRYQRLPKKSSESRRAGGIESYKRDFGYIVKRFKPYSVDFTPRPKPQTPMPYEKTKEAQRLIFEVMAREMTKDLVPYPSAEQEIELAKRIEAGMWAEMRLMLGGNNEEKAHIIEHLAEKMPGFDPKYLPLNNFSRADLELCARDGREAVLHFMLAYVNFAYSVTNTRYDGRNLISSEKKAASLEGLLRAVRKFDYTRGHRFSTYAWYWVVSSNQQYRYKNTYDGVPARIIKEWEKIIYHHGHLMQQLRTESVTMEQLAEATGLTAKKVQSVIEIMTPYITLGSTATWRHDPAHQTDSPRHRFGQAFAAGLDQLFAAEPQTREIVKLCFEEKCSVAEIAEEKGLSIGEVERRLKGAVEAIRPHIKDWMANE
jgi:RNA polymerase sigma factor (sigma-70 family)